MTAPSPSRDIPDFALRIRRHVLAMTHRAGASHIGTSYSMAEILAVLYGRILRYDHADPAAPDRDRFILSKGHGAAGLYAALAESGFFPVEWLDDFCTDGSPLGGHVSRAGVPGVEASSGSLGHGLGIACGMAIAAKRDSLDHRVFALLSDGECDEGSTWEAILLARHQRLDNLCAIVDYNKIQSFGRVEEVLELEPFAEKWRAFGWAVRDVDGHDCDALHAALAGVPFLAGQPSCLIAHTVKGKGVGFMEDRLLWHYKSPDEAERRAALDELERR